MSKPMSFHVHKAKKDVKMSIYTYITHLNIKGSPNPYPEEILTRVALLGIIQMAVSLQKPLATLMVAVPTLAS
jgi:hypothetical protein